MEVGSWTVSFRGCINGALARRLRYHIQTSISTEQCLEMYVESLLSVNAACSVVLHHLQQKSSVHKT